ncbi:hypothetical protein A4X13_0g4577 [Tilletia indica]|uniref:Alpha/beta hydrolase fold-3 domain-containing protein n=1 Tax=Tilletia indica TaxID=43049 RepID=A0A177TVQ2_9BASI|nr:hypothetical protein A4X13_0g4577 [Tilletia indica]
MFRVTTREYKNYSYTDRTGSTQQRSISLDVYLPEGIDCWRNPLLRFSEPHKKPPLGFGGLVERERVAPLVVWVHPGGFLQGTRKVIPPHLQRAVENHRLVVVIPDYRLCPQVTLIESLTDIRDACEYALGGALGDQVNTSTWALGGNSAGGWAALLLGLGLMVPPPQAFGTGGGGGMSGNSGSVSDAAAADSLAKDGLGFRSSSISSPPRRRNESSSSASGTGATAAAHTHATPSSSTQSAAGSTSEAQGQGSEHAPLPTLSRLPRAVFAIYPITDITRQGGACYYKPLKPITWTPSVTAAVGPDGIIDGDLLQPFLRKPGHAPLGASTEDARETVGEEEEGEEDASAVVTSSDPENDPIRSQLFNYARQEGIFPSLIIPTDLPPERVSIPSLLKGDLQSGSAAAATPTTPASAGPSSALPLSTSTPSLSSRSPLLNLPPTFIAWGDADERVPPSQSFDAVKALQGVGAEVQTHVVEGKEHLFDYEADVEIPGLWRWVMQKMNGLR